jgi:hypothetical protein
MGARRAVASRVGATVVDGRKMRAAADDRGPHGKLEKIVKKKKNPKSRTGTVRIFSYHYKRASGTIPYRT